MFKVLKTVVLKEHHSYTGAIKFFVAGEPMKRPFELRIVDNDGDGYLLFYCDKNGEEINDTWAETIEAAMQDAERAFQVKPDEWETVA